MHTIVPTTLPIEGSSELFPVGRVYCVGRNYAAHAIEMGHDPDREPPFFFMKPADAVVEPGELDFPVATEELHHEIELVAALARGGRDITVEDALDHVFGYAVGLDMTRRDLQSRAKELGRPWEIGKAFDESAPIGALHPTSEVGHPRAGAIWLKVDGQERQSGDLDQLIWNVAEMISHLSGLLTLRPGDLIMTGTPAGVGPVHSGEAIEGGIDGIGEIRIAYR